MPQYHMIFDEDDKEDDEDEESETRHGSHNKKRKKDKDKDQNHEQQKKRYKNQYAMNKRTGRDAEESAEKAEQVSEGFAETVRVVVDWVKEHKKAALIILAIVIVLVFIVCAFSSCAALFQGTEGAVVISTYPSADEDMLDAEAYYCGLEADLQTYLDDYEKNHDYDEYHYDLDTIEHDPYNLISFLTAWNNGSAWTVDEMKSVMDMIFDQQYILTETTQTEIRYREETHTEIQQTVDAETGEVLSEEEIEVTEQVPYEYKIQTVTLENFNLSHLPIYTMSEEQLEWYALYMSCLGNRPDLFPTSSYITAINGAYLDYEIPPEALEDEQFARMMAEATKYLGLPYVWGGSSPSTGFDCSGYVSWVLNHSGWNVGRLGATALGNMCTPVSAANAKPGDLVLFVGTYDTTGYSHVGIYVGNGMMIHCGNPIQYANLNSSYWQAHLAFYGRLPSPSY